MRAREFITESLRLSDEKRGSKISITMLKDGEEIGSNQYNAATGRSIVEVDEQYRNKGYGKILILKMLELCAENSLDFVIDESTTDAYDNTLYSLEDAGYIVIDDQYVYLTEDGLNYLNEFMTLKEDTISLNQFYQNDFPDRDEAFWEYVTNSELNTQHEIQTMQPYKLEILLKGQYRIEHVDELYDIMDSYQQKLVKTYAKQNLANQIIVIADGRIIDGNHRALAAVKSKQPIKFINLDDIEE